MEPTETPKYAGEPVPLEGKDWIVPSLSTADFRKFYSVLIDTDITTSNITEKLGAHLAVATAALKRNYPDLTEEQLGNMTEPMQLFEIVRIVASRSGLRPAKPGE